MNNFTACFINTTTFEMEFFFVDALTEEAAAITAKERLIASGLIADQFYLDAIAITVP